MCQAAQNLKEINVEYLQCSQLGLAAIGQYCHNMDADEGFAALAQGCRKLKTLTLPYGLRLSDIGIIAIATHCTQLEELRLVESYSISDASLMALAQHVGANLKFLSLESCNGVETGEGILATAKHCPHLHTVQYSDLSMNATLQGNIVQSIPYWKNVMELNLSNGSVEDNILYMIGEHMQLLENLAIRKNEHQCTCAALKHIVTRCEKLKGLDLGEPHREVTADILAEWQQIRPGLELKSFLEYPSEFNPDYDVGYDTEYTE